MTRLLKVASLTIAGFSVVCFAVSFIPPSTELSLINLAWPVPNIVVGLLLTYRRPRLLTGWLFSLIGLLVTTGAAADALVIVGTSTGAYPWWAVLGAWYGEWYWLPLIYTMLVFLPMVFPSGSPPTPLLRRLTRLILLVLVAGTVLAALQFQLDPTDGPPVVNPVGIRGLGDVEYFAGGGVFVVVTALSLLTALVGVITRYRRSTGVERQQLKWFTSAGVMLIVGFVVQAMIDASGRERLEILDLTLFALPPFAAAIAILRYRLYAIDRIISRTVTYALVTALLVGVYVGAVALLSAAVDPVAGESPFAVATATLMAAALFRPARRRIQDQVDLRFNRGRYDAQRTLDGFRERVRSDVDLDRLCSDLVTVTHDTFQPRATVVWLAQEA